MLNDLDSCEPSKRDEGGAVAILVAILALVLFGVAAIVVDLGNAYARKGDSQIQADFAALAGAAHLPGTKVHTDPVVQAVAEYFVDNAAADDDATATVDVAAMAANLVNGVDADGEVYFTAKYRLRVVSPLAHVSFGFAGVFATDGSDGYEGVEVSSDATVKIGTGSKTLPYFVADTCSFLQQTIVDPANGHGSAYDPALQPAGDASYGVTLRSITPSGTPVAVNPGQMTLVAQGGQTLRDVYKIGFTTEDFGISEPSLHHEVILSAPLSGGDSVTFDVPPSVYDTEAVWYVRVWKYTGPSPAPANPPTGSGTWSAAELPFTVGAPPMYCQGSQSGNFGSLQLSRNDASEGEYVAKNTALGIQHSIAIHPNGAAAPQPCAGTTGSQTASFPNYTVAPSAVNCLTTEPGVVSQATTGMIVGGNGFKGLLDTSQDAAATTCDANGGNDDLHVTINGHGSFDLNNDVLTCFITDPAVSVGMVSRKTGAPGDVISPKIFQSPRFFYLPVLGSDPTNGRNSTWPIIDFRPAFLTGQPAPATSDNPMPVETATASNGLVVDGNGVEQLRVVLLNDNAFPESADLPGDVIDYIGVGTKIIRLID